MTRVRATIPTWSQTRKSILARLFQSVAGVLLPLERPLERPHLPDKCLGGMKRVESITLQDATFARRLSQVRQHFIVAK